MEFFGNVFTHYNYTTTDIQQTKNNALEQINSKLSGLNVAYDTGGENVSLPTHSPFADWKEARRFAGPLPFTFTYNQSKKEVLIIEGVRENWTPAPVHINSYTISFIDELNLKGAVLANAFIIKGIPYYWKKGKIESWK